MGLHTDCVSSQLDTVGERKSTRQLHKFGGSSLADVECYLRVAEIVRDYCGHSDLFVVSAAGKTTNRLIEFVDMCGSDPTGARRLLESLLEFQVGLVEGLLSASDRRRTTAILRTEFTWIRSQSETIIEDDALRARILGHGEVWSARLLANLLSQLGMPADWLDARDLLRADNGPQPVINEAISGPRVQSAVNGLANSRIVITGFMASNGIGDTVLLGRNGSDYSATMIGILAGSPQITIWSDVAGVYSADPRKIETAELLPSISLREANELANLGASVLHRRSLQPVIRHQVSVALRSSYEPESESTTLHRGDEEFGPKVVTTLDQVVIFQVSLSEAEDLAKVKSAVLERMALHELQPLACQVREDGEQLCFVFPAVLTQAAGEVLESMRLSVLATDQALGLVAVVGAGSGSSKTTSELFANAVVEECGQPPELVTQTELSLFALVPGEFVHSLAERLHRELNVGCATSSVCRPVE